MSKHESPPGATKGPSACLSHVQGLKAAAACAVGAIALALPASGLSAPAPLRSRPPMTPPGALTQLPGASGCLVDRATPAGAVNLSGRCGDQDRCLGSDAVAVSPDGSNLYVASAAARRSPCSAQPRDRKTRPGPGAAGCVADGGAGGCGLAVGLGGPNSVAVSPDGNNVYATAANSNSVAIFRRDSNDGGADPVARARRVHRQDRNVRLHECDQRSTGPTSSVVSPDGKNVYVGAFFGDAVVAFARNASTGALTQLPGQQRLHRRVDRRLRHRPCDKPARGSGDQRRRHQRLCSGRAQRRGRRAHPQPGDRRADPGDRWHRLSHQHSADRLRDRQGAERSGRGGRQRRRPQRVRRGGDIAEHRNVQSRLGQRQLDPASRRLRLRNEGGCVRLWARSQSWSTQRDS